MSKNHLKEMQILLNDMSMVALEQPHATCCYRAGASPAASEWPCDLCVTAVANRAWMQGTQARVGYSSLNI
jgi:hypothetical protein